MKRNGLIFLTIMIMTIVFSSSAYALKDIQIFIDGEQKIFSPPPIIQSGTTLVPMRDCFETLGTRILWNGETRSVLAIREETYIKVAIDKHDAYINGKEKYLDVVPKLIGNKTYVPLRFVSESLGAQVYWDGDTRTITIYDKEKPKDQIEITDTQKFKLETTFEFINQGDKIDSEFEVLCGAVSNSPYQTDEFLKVKPSATEYFKDEYGNKYAKIEINDIMPDETFEIVVTKELTNSGIEYFVDKENILKDYENMKSYETYISPQHLIESNNPQIQQKAAELAGEENNPYKIAKKVFSFVNQHMTYDESSTYARKGALNALNTGRGVCEDYSKLFVALLRANKIPSRSVFGYCLNDNIKPELEYDSWHNLKSVAHEWPEFYLPEYGWIIAEPTFMYTYNGKQSVPWEQFAKQDGCGHVIYGYEPNTDNTLKWNIKGYGELNLNFKGMKAEIKRVN